MLEQALGKTAITVQNPRDDEYETDGRAYLGLKRDARDIKLGMPPPNKAGGQPSKPSNSERLSELKADARQGPHYRTGISSKATSDSRRDVEATGHGASLGAERCFLRDGPWISV
jgi:hypothetical protein